jgi:hypothetical protein
MQKDFDQFQVGYDKRTRDEAFDGHDDDDDKKGRRKIKIEYIEDKSRRHITFSKRKAGIMKKAYELSTLTGTQVLLLVASETGHVYTFATPKLQPLITKPEGKDMIQRCLNAPDVQRTATPNYTQYQPTPAPSPAPTRPVSSMSMQYSEVNSPQMNRQLPEPDYAMPSYPTMYNSAGLPLSPQMVYNGSQATNAPSSSGMSSRVSPQEYEKPHDHQNGYYEQPVEDTVFQPKEIPQGYQYYPVQQQGYFRQPPRSMTPGVDMPSRQMTPLEMPARSLTPGLDMSRVNVDLRMPQLDLSRMGNSLVSEDIRSIDHVHAEHQDV